MKNISFIRFFVLGMCFIFLFPLSCCPVTEAISEYSETMKGVWVASVYNLDYPSKPTQDVDTLKNETIKILDNVKNMGLNTVFLQVRPSADAFYDSDIFPWSKYLTGVNGVAPNNNFDPLEFWISEAHKRNIELHAWINPYRITKGSDSEYAQISNDSPAKKYSQYVVKYSDGNYYFDPAYPEVRELVINGAVEIVKNYDVDGIHMDDYFYPGQNFDDAKSYAKYGAGFADIGDFRRNNVDLLVQELNTRLHEVNSNIVFGISPSGVWANKKNNSLGSDTNGSESYYNLYADTRKWVKEEWVDYIAPQIYWNIGHSAADYETLLKWWSDVVKNTDTLLYIGMADYKTENAESTSVWYNGKEIQKQLQMNDSISNIVGEIHYRYSSLMAEKVLKDIITEFYTKANNEVKVLVNGKELVFDQPPVIEDGRTLVPIRTIFENLGADVMWNDATKTVVAKKDDNTISLTIGSKIMSRGEKRTELDVVAKVINGRTLVPLRAVSEAFDMSVSWLKDTKTVIIN